MRRYTALSEERLPQKVYVQHRLCEHARDVWDWLEQGAELFVLDGEFVDEDGQIIKGREDILATYYTARAYRGVFGLGNRSNFEFGDLTRDFGISGRGIIRKT
jgi:hypothetical protein